MTKTPALARVQSDIRIGVVSPKRRSGKRSAVTTLLTHALLLSPWLAACASQSHVGTDRQPGSADDEPKSIPAFTEGMEAIPGFLPAFWDARKGKVFIEPRLDGEELLYVVSLPAGLGSNRVGLDRAQLGPQHVAYFRRIGPKVLLVAPILIGRRARRRSRASRSGRLLCVVGPVGASRSRRRTTGAFSSMPPTSFFATHTAWRARCAAAQQGGFSLDPKRSAPWMESTRGYPDNTELEVLLTLVGDSPGGEVRATSADPSAVSVRVRHSFVRLPTLHPRVTVRAAPILAAGTMVWAGRTWPRRSTRRSNNG